MIKRFIQFKLGLWSRMVLWRQHAIVIAVTGSVGKTTTKDAIGKVLIAHFGAEYVVVSSGNYNTEIGVPLTVLRSDHPGRSILGWLALGIRAFWLFMRGGGPNIYVLEFAADKPGDIKHLGRIAPPLIGVVTAVGEIPVHVEYYETPEEVAVEKGRLIEMLPRNGVAILNVDEGCVWDMRGRTFAKVVGVGVGKDATIRASSVVFNPENLFSDSNPSAVLKVDTLHQSIPLRLDNVLTRGQIFSALAAIAVGRAVGVPLLECIESLQDWTPPAGRLRPILGLRESIILDDSYNASPLSMRMALETLGVFQKHRRIAVIGDMREIGKYSEEAHEQAGRHAVEHADMLIAVGQYASTVVSGAEEGGLAKEFIYSEYSASDAADTLYKIVKKGDVVLVKGSRAVGMDIIVQTLSSGVLDG